MRVITGTAKGRRLETLEGEDVRPTTERIKEAVFSIIQFEIMGHTFLDLFAGSGQMGIEAKGRRLETLEGEDVRPTTERIKEAVFSIIQFEIMGHTFLDLFAGSGQMGIEAISRGASSAYFVDASKKSLDVVRKNVSAVKFDKEAKLFAMDYRSFLSMNSTEFDIAFLDPPYKKGILQDALPIVAENMRETGIIIAENPLDEQISANYGDFVLDREYRYGKIKISTFRHKDFL